MALKKSQKSLNKWTSEDWDYVSAKDRRKPKSERGRYLPKSGKTHAKYGKAVLSKMRNR